MIHVDRHDDVVRVAPNGHYAQGEFVEAIDRALALCPSGLACGLILDFSLAFGVEQHSVVRVRETTRELAARRARYAHRIAVIASGELLVHVMEVGGAVSRQHGITYRYCGCVHDAVEWLMSDDASPG